MLYTILNKILNTMARDTAYYSDMCHDENVYVSELSR